MRKFLFLLVLLPALVALGHDVYIYTQNQTKGFRLSDTGALWDKYHKQSHDQWKIKLKEFNEAVEDLNPAQQAQEVTENTDDYSASFTQDDNEGRAHYTAPIKKKDGAQIKVSNLQKFVGFLLEQKAVFVFFGFAGIIFFINVIISLPFREKTSEENLSKIKKIKRKGGGYKYGRK